MKFFLSPFEFIDTQQGIDLSIPITTQANSTRAWHSQTPKIIPVQQGNFIGSVARGASVNFRTIAFSPHGNSTHTECLGHITHEVFSINDTLKDFFFDALLISLQPREVSTMDRVITAEQIHVATANKKCQALIIRTLPNSENKLTTNYSDTNPPYLEAQCAKILDDLGVEHLLVDMPSVDKEHDGGALAMHRSFWQVPENPQYHKTITELIFVPDTAIDGRYILNLQLAPIENDASPSRPIIYSINKVKHDLHELAQDDR